MSMREVILVCWVNCTQAFPTERLSQLIHYMVFILLAAETALLNDVLSGNECDWPIADIDKHEQELR